MSNREQAEKRHEIKVGITILVGIAIIIFAIMSVGNQQGLLNDRYQLRVLMSRVNGLQSGAPVRLAGVRVGSVVGVDFSSDLEDQKIEVVLEIDKTVQNRIRQDSEAHIGTLGLLGDKFIGLTMGSLDQPVLQNNELLKSSDPIDVEKIIDEGVNVVNGLKRATKEIEEISGKINSGKGTLGLIVNDPRIYFSLDRLLNLVELIGSQVANSEGTLNMLLNDSTFAINIAESVKNMRELSDSLKTGQGTAARLISDPEMYNKIDTSVSKLNSIITKIEKGEGSVGKAISNEDLYNDMTRITTELDSLVKDVRKNPQRYLKVEIF